MKRWQIWMQNPDLLLWQNVWRWRKMPVSSVWQLKKIHALLLSWSRRGNQYHFCSVLTNFLHCFLNQWKGRVRAYRRSSPQCRKKASKRNWRSFPVLDEKRGNFFFLSVTKQIYISLTLIRKDVLNYLILQGPLVNQKNWDNRLAHPFLDKCRSTG